MFCTHCGQHLPDGSQNCSRCGKPLPLAGASRPDMPPPPPPPPNFAPPPPRQAPAYNPAPPQPQHVGGAPVPTHLGFAIFITLCCCQLFGVIAIIFAAQASGKNNSGDFFGAEEAAGKASTFCWIGLVGGIVSWLLGLAYMVLVVLVKIEEQGGFR